MVAQLKGLLGKSPRPIVVCGRPLMDDRALITASLENYRVVFKNSRYGHIIDSGNGIARLHQAVQSFEEEFGGILQGYTRGTSDNGDEVQVHACVDSFTGAVIIETDSYRELIKQRLHSSEMQLTVTQEVIVRKFAVRHLQNYCEIFTLLFNRRIVAQHMPIMIKCHMVKGLFQPLVVETVNLPSPFRYDENKWLYDVLRPSEVFLEHKEDGVRKLNFSCVAMCDIASAFNTRTIQELDRRSWVVMLTLICLSQLSQESSQETFKRFGYYTQRLKEGAPERALFDAMSTCAFSRNKTIAKI